MDNSRQCVVTLYIFAFFILYKTVKYIIYLCLIFCIQIFCIFISTNKNEIRSSFHFFQVFFCSAHISKLVQSVPYPPFPGWLLSSVPSSFQWDSHSLKELFLRKPIVLWKSHVTALNVYLQNDFEKNGYFKNTRDASNVMLPNWGRPPV